jgi:hypothetical protein
MWEILLSGTEHPWRCANNDKCDPLLNHSSTHRLNTFTFADVRPVQLWGDSEHC